MFKRLSKAVRCRPILLFLFAMMAANGVGCVRTAQADQKKGVVVAFAARVAGDSNRTRLVVDFDRTLRYSVQYLENPNRVIIDLPETVFSLGQKNSDLVRGVVTDFRYGAIAPGRSRIVLSTGVPVLVERFSLKPLGDDGHQRLMLDFVKTDHARYSAAIFKQAGSIGRSGNVAHKGDRIRRGKNRKEKKFTVVVDPGHGGIDGGAEGVNSKIEKDITLGFSLALKKVLEGDPRIRVLLTRERDVFVSLNERVSFARRNQADLMLSIHADTLKQRFVRGATIYTLSEEGSDELARALAEKENRSDLIAGLALSTKATEVADILIELTQRETRLFSNKFATALVTQLKGRIPLIKNPKRDANFHVLRAPDIPSVLFEMGYLSNKKDEKQLSSPEWQAATAIAVKKAILSFFNTRIAQGG